MKSLRFATAALISGLASWLLPLMLIAYGFATDTGYDKLGAPDDTPFRAGYALLVLSPVFVLLMSIYYALVGGALRLAKRESLKALVVVSGLLALLIGIVFARQGVVIELIRGTSYLIDRVGTMVARYKYPYSFTN